MATNNVKAYPLLESQIGVVLGCIKYPDAQNYNNPYIYHLSKAIKYERLSEAWDAIIKARKEWRARFVMTGGEWSQYADDTMTVPMKHSFMSEAQLADYKNSFASMHFDLFSGAPLLMAEFVETESRNYLLLNVHHSILDGTTISAFNFKDLPLAYAGEPLPPSDYGMYEHAVAEKEWLGTADTLLRRRP